MNVTMAGALGGPLRIRLLGGFEVAIGAAPVPDQAFRLRKAKSLIKLLALAPERRLHRARVAELLWPDRDADSSANNLHQAMFAARRALDSVVKDAGAYLVMHEHSLGLDGQGANAVEVDVDAFVTAAQRARKEPALDSYANVLALYAGDLLPGDSDETWTRVQRQALQELHAGLLLELCELHAATGAAPAAIEAAQQAVLAHPLHEGAHRTLMRRFVAGGRRQEALAQYERLRELLRSELEAKPDPETRRLYQEILTQAGAAPEASVPQPSAAARAGTTASLPARLTSFVGRERECEEVRGLLERGRLVTLIGPGGCGKTRLALEVAAASQAQEPEVLFVELAAVSDPALVAQQLATALGIELRSERDAASVVIEQISQRRLLLVLDNCEHLIGSCAQLLQKLLHACPALRVLATSREALRVLGELCWRVPSLSLPDPNGPLDLPHIVRTEAVRLFLERATGSGPGFVRPEDHAAAIAQICLRLDGMPLAIELAAARTAALSPVQIAERLRDSFAVLGQGNRGALTRQQTLAATIGWSYDLLEDAERTLLQRLAVFAGGFGLEAVEQICSDAELERARIADLLARLVDKSLVLASDEGGERRYRLLETVKQYAAERLDAARARAQIELRHVDFYLSLAAASDPDAGCSDDFADRLERDHDNLRAALAAALERASDEALHLSTHVCAFWMARGYFAEGTRWLEQALSANPAQTSLRARALLQRAGLAVRRGQVDRIRAPGYESIAIQRTLEEPRALADALLQTAMLECMLDDQPHALRLLVESRELAEQLRDDTALASLRFCEGTIAYARADYEQAVVAFRQAHDQFAAIGGPFVPVFPAQGVGLVVVDEAEARPRGYYEDTYFTFRRVNTRAAAGWALANLSVTQRSAGELEAARESIDGALALLAPLGDRMSLAMALNLAGNLARSLGEFARGRHLLEQAIDLRRELRDRRGVGLSLGNLALLEARAGDRTRALLLLDQARELFTRTEDMPGMTAVHMNLGSIELAAGEFHSASRALAQARALAARQTTRRVAGWLSITLAEAALDEAERARAATDLAQARDWFAGTVDMRAERRIALLAAQLGPA
jgi:predicted ATPase/DNA-binding SARP family transcriptional activator